jgi:succinoglycan biosynthesis protein ExoV
MKLHYYKPSGTNINFGDEINVELWKYYFGNFFNNDTDRVFFGIGTIFRAAQKFYPSSKIIIFGSGSHQNKYTFVNETEIYFVRGPLSARALNLNHTYGITDPALLIDEVYPVKNPIKRFKFGYIPHFSVENKEYKKAVNAAGVHFISPNQKPIDVINEINSCHIIITEAMHGAIVADTYNIPWIPVFSYTSFNHFKWKDWTESLNLEIKFNKLPRLHERSNIKSMLKRKLFIYRLNKIKFREQYLSQKSLKENLKKQLIEKIIQFKKDRDILDY